MRMLEKCYDNKMAKLPGDSSYRNFHMRLAKKKKKKIFYVKFWKIVRMKWRRISRVHFHINIFT